MWTDIAETFAGWLLNVYLDSKKSKDTFRSCFANVTNIKGGGLKLCTAKPFRSPARPGFGEALARLWPGFGQALARLWPGLVAYIIP